MSEVEDALGIEDGPAELILDVTRYGGEDQQTAEIGQVSVFWGKEDLEQILRKAEGDSVTLAFDPNELLAAFEADVEAHGLREVAAVLAVAIAAGAGAGVASAQTAEGTTLGGSTAIEQVRADAGTAPGATIEAVRSAEAAAANTAAGAQIEAVRLAGGTETIAASGTTDIEAVRSLEAAAPNTSAGGQIEAVRLAGGTETIAASGTSEAGAGIEAVRSAEIAASTGGPQGAASVETARSSEIAASVPSVESAGSIEAVRASAAEAARAAADTGGGIGVSLPSPATTGMVGGGIALLITGAAFAAARKQRVRPV